MAFNLFGKRDKTPDPDPVPEQHPDPNPEQAPELKRGLFDRMRAAVTRTRTTLQESMGAVLALTREVDTASLDDLVGTLADLFC